MKNPGAQSSRSSALGFTLIEVIVALAILSLIMLATISAMRTFANTQSSLDRLSGRIDEIRTVSSFLRDTLDSTVFAADSGGLSLGGHGGQELAYFAGTANSVDWKAPILFGEGFGGTFLLRLAHEQDQLLLRWQEPVEPGLPVDWNDTESRVMVASVQAFEVGFLPDFGREWEEEWDSLDSPALIRLRIKANEKYWPDLIMQVQR
jgi:general secretion pathway protein J